MDYTKVHLNTFIPMMPSLLNKNFDNINNYINVFYDENDNYIKSPISTNGTFKSSKGEFISLIVDDLIVKNNANIVEDNSDVKNEITFIENLSTNAASYGTTIDNKCHINVDKYYYNINNYSYIYEFITTNLGTEIFITFNGDTALKGKIFLNNNTYVEISFDTTKPYVIPYIKLICTGFIQDKPIWTIADRSYGINNFILKDNSIPELSDLDILRQIRDANPTSQLPSLWLDSEDPYIYGNWEGVTWNAEKTRVTSLNLDNTYGLNSNSDLSKINKLTGLTILQLTNIGLLNVNIDGLINLIELYLDSNQLETIDISKLINLTTIGLNNNKLTYLNTSNLVNLVTIGVEHNMLTELYLPTTYPSLNNLYISYNNLTSLSTLTAQGIVFFYDFKYNNFPTSELDRFSALGFTNESRLLPQNE